MSIKRREGGVAGARALLARGAAHLHFAGICGISMSALAEYFSNRGYLVSGSDASPGEMGRRLSALGISVSGANSAEYMSGAAALIITSAISEDSPECLYAKAHGIPIYTRAELLGALMLDYPYRIGVSGTHGKSTTTAMIEHIFAVAGRRYTAFVGAPVFEGSGLRLSGGEGIIYESCEYRDAFHAFSPTTAAVTGVELDHTDYFKDIAALCASFSRAVRGAEYIVINSDYKTTEEIIKGARGEVITYGVDKRAFYRYNIISSGKDGTSAALYRGAECLGEVRLPLLGEYNIANATAAVATAAIHGIDPGEAIEALRGFSGVPRRLEYLGRLGERPVFYDYAHHPTEISSALGALRASWGGAVVVFRPHTYSRTRDLWDMLIGALSLADEVVITDIYPAREDEVEGVSSARLAAALGERARYIPLEDLGAYLVSATDGGTPLVIMGAGDMAEALSELKKILK